MTSETVGALLAILPAVPDSTVEDLIALLKYELAEDRVSHGSPSSRLGLLAAMLPRFRGELPSVVDYNNERDRETRSWPSGSQLAREYGGWLRALHSAESLARGESPLPRHRGSSSSRYSDQELVLALLKFRRQVGAWPATGHEFSRWANLSRAVNRRWGSAEARVPGLDAIVRRFGDLESAVSQSRRSSASED